MPETVRMVTLPPEQGRAGTRAAMSQAATTGGDVAGGDVAGGWVAGREVAGGCCSLRVLGGTSAVLLLSGMMSTGRSRRKRNDEVH
jgi:hypothetical protein